eukprot:NODE_11293_length_461_cov_17.494083_g10638_i0.p1 GENE.NODE_11293_length_461_cov_17.494083_g10638_i0~~NODE_11293_length_461_cov_17.494083_g10638_i0.p1  ORF type:complete len:107 (-),score=22.72 NODE_11293_length_461_cov_17.494083_g10638_i0:96-416(-)
MIRNVVSRSMLIPLRGFRLSSSGVKPPGKNPHDEEDLEWLEADKTISQEEHYARKRQKELLDKLSKSATNLTSKQEKPRSKKEVESAVEALQKQLDELKTHLKDGK